MEGSELATEARSTEARSTEGSSSQWTARSGDALDARWMLRAKRPPRKCRQGLCEGAGFVLL
jgi:hypothetical protein